MGAFKFLGGKGTYPWTECDEINLDWFIDQFFQLCNYVKAESEDTKSMKRWILNGGVVKDVLVNGRSVLDKGIAKIDLGSIAVKVKDVFYEGVSVVNEQGIAVLPKLPEVIVKGVKNSKGDNLVNAQGIAVIPEQECKVEDVRVNGQTAVENKIANVKTCTKVAIAGNYSTVQENGEIKFTALDVGLILADGSYIGKQDAIKRKLSIPTTAEEFRTACNILPVEGVEF